MKQSLKKDIEILTQMIAVDGAEQEVAKYIKNRMEKVCDCVEVSPIGTVTGRIKGEKPGKKVMVTAHMDEIGMMVKNITEEGFILFEKVGDYSDKVLPARKVWIQTNKGRVPGVIGLRAAHIMTPEEAAKAQTSKQSYIDVGAFSREEAQRYGVRLGDKIVLQSDFMEMANPDLISAKCMDDRVGCALLLNLMETIDKAELEGELIAVFSVLEEMIVAGMIGPVRKEEPDYVIALDTVPCGDVPDVDTAKELPVYMNKGPVLIISQGEPPAYRYSFIHPKLRAAFEQTAEELEMPLQELVISENVYITEATIMHMTQTPAVTMAIPRRYSHTPIELLHMDDAVKSFRLLKRFVEKHGNLDLSFL